MNDIESTKEVLKKMRDEIEEHGNTVNSKLDAFKIRHIDVSKAITNFEQQIKSAESKFTIAFVGTFKMGKSTTINSLLELKKDARLSSEYDPDTAKCIRLICADDDHKAGTAEVDFDGYFPTEKLSWKEAKKYTSQVALDKEDDMFREKADHIDEVRYYVDSPLLKLCNILDLPGTGAGGAAGSQHTKVTRKKLLEADIVFWVVSTSAVPGNETVKNLQDIKHKLLPIINVWQKECDGIKSDISPEQIIAFIKENFSAYLANADDPVIYYAGEIDNAQQNGGDIKPEWGKKQFTDKVESILENINSGDRAAKMRVNLTSAVTECARTLEELKSDPALADFHKDAKTDKQKNDKLQRQLAECRRLAYGNVQQEAIKTAEEIIKILTNATEAFINSKMVGLDFKAVFKKKKEYGAELRREYRDNFIRIKDGWIENAAKDYTDNVKVILDGMFINFADDSAENIQGGTLDDNILDIGNFAENIAANLQQNMLSKLIPLLVQTVTGIVLLCIPGLNLLDSVYMIFAGFGGAKGLAQNDQLQQRAKAVILQSNAQIRMQKYTISEALKKNGKDITEQYYTGILNELKAHGEELNGQLEKYTDLMNSIEVFCGVLDAQNAEIEKLFSKEYK